MLWKITTSVGNFQFGHHGGGKEKIRIFFLQKFSCNGNRKQQGFGLLGEILWFKDRLK